MKECPNCSKSLPEHHEIHPKLKTCSVPCTREWMEKTNAKFDPLPFRRMNQKGAGKNHSIWVQEKHKQKL